jgi:hypothetical protein
MRYSRTCHQGEQFIRLLIRRIARAKFSGDNAFNICSETSINELFLLLDIATRYGHDEGVDGVFFEKRGDCVDVEVVGDGDDPRFRVDGFGGLAVEDVGRECGMGFESCEDGGTEGAGCPYEGDVGDGHGGWWVVDVEGFERLGRWLLF